MLKTTTVDNQRSQRQLRLGKVLHQIQIAMKMFTIEMSRRKNFPKI